MTKRLNLLVIAPFAPPTNSAEAIQVGRIMAQLDQHACGLLVSGRPLARGWARQDASLALPLQHFTFWELALPWHRVTSRVWGSHRLARFHSPDAMMWMRWQVGAVIRGLTQKPDVIYSRSGPMSGALLAMALQKKLGVPWMMHLSDPWADSASRTVCPRDAAYEAACFAAADSIALTTVGQADYYRKKYPEYAGKILVSPNVMPEPEEMACVICPDSDVRDDRLHLVFAGNLYLGRSPKPLMDALLIVRATAPYLLEKLRIDVYGNAQEPALSQLRSMPEVVHYHGAVSFAQAFAAQKTADAVVTIEADSDDTLIKSILLSKVTDCLALGKPMLAITPRGSETAAICEEGYGWAISPADPQEIAQLIVKLITQVNDLRARPPKTPPVRYRAAMVVEQLLAHMYTLLAEDHSRG